MFLSIDLNKDIKWKREPEKSNQYFNVDSVGTYKEINCRLLRFLSLRC